jgi:hypothetical protein
MNVTIVIEQYGNSIVRTNVSSKFDMTGLPEPLVYAFYFLAHGDRIVQLIILRSHTTFESGRSAVAGALGHQLPRHFATGAPNASISQKTLQFYKSTSRRGSLYLSPAA